MFKRNRYIYCIFATHAASWYKRACIYFVFRLFYYKICYLSLRVCACLCASVCICVCSRSYRPLVPVFVCMICALCTHYMSHYLFIQSSRGDNFFLSRFHSNETAWLFLAMCVINKVHFDFEWLVARANGDRNFIKTEHQLYI